METMNAKMFFKHWDRVNDITLRLIKQIPEDKLDLKPTPKNFSAKELMVHTYHCERVFAETSVTGKAAIEDFQKPEYMPPQINTVDELYQYAKEVHEITNEKVASMSNEELITKMVKAPWGDMPVFYHINGAYEHLWHHRGQLYIYLRMAGVENPVDVFDYQGLPV